MTRFDIFILHANGEEQLIYTALDYEHPPVLQLDTPLTIKIDGINGSGIILKTTGKQEDSMNENESSGI